MTLSKKNATNLQHRIFLTDSQHPRFSTEDTDHPCALPGANFPFKHLSCIPRPDSLSRAKQRECNPQAVLTVLVSFAGDLEKLHSFLNIGTISLFQHQAQNTGHAFLTK